MIYKNGTLVNVKKGPEKILGAFYTAYSLKLTA